MRDGEQLCSCGDVFPHGPEKRRYMAQPLYLSGEDLMELSMYVDLKEIRQFLALIPIVEPPGFCYAMHNLWQTCTVCGGVIRGTTSMMWHP